MPAQALAKWRSRSATAGPATRTAVSRYGSPVTGDRFRPLVVDARAPDRGVVAVDRQQLRVIAREQLQGRAEAGRVDDAHVDARGAELAPEGARHIGRAPPVVEDPHPHAGCGALLQRLGKLSADAARLKM